MTAMAVDSEINVHVNIFYHQPLSGDRVAAARTEDLKGGKQTQTVSENDSEAAADD
jgi:hypothetical protein